MKDTKQEVMTVLENLPDDCTLEDVQYHLFVLQKIQKGLKDGEEGRVYTPYEMENRMGK